VRKPAAGLPLAKPDVLGNGGAECAAADDDYIERLSAGVSPAFSLFETVAEVAALNVARESGSFRRIGH
jgi:hypothetical protein